MTKIVVKVTQEHIDRGQPISSCDCPIALAMREAGYIDVEVGPVHIEMGGKQFELPPEAQMFIRYFDSTQNRVNIQPFSFELDVV